MQRWTLQNQTLSHTGNHQQSAGTATLQSCPFTEHFRGSAGTSTNASLNLQLSQISLKFVKEGKLW